MLGWVLLWSCRAEVAVIVDARGGGAGYWPAHSATAVEGAIEAGFDSFEVDVTPTADGEWLLQGGLRWVDCIDVGTGLAPNPRTVADWSSEGSRALRCGGTADPDHPNALVVSEPPMLFRQLLDVIRGGEVAEQRVHLHLRLDEDRPELVHELLQAWQDADLPNPLLISTDTLATLLTVQRARRLLGLASATTLRGSDEEPSSDEPNLDASSWEDLESAGVDGLALRAEQWNASRRRSARRHALELMVLRPDDLDRWPTEVTSVLTDHPGDLPRSRR